MASQHRTGVADAGEDVAERFLGHLAEAIRFRTVSGDPAGRRDEDAFRGFRRWVASTYPRVWESGSPEVVGDDSLVFTLEGADIALPPVLLMGHIDVVPVAEGSETSWSAPPFGGERSDTHLFGRGAIDDKGSVVAILEAVEAGLSSGPPLRRSLYLAFGHDEEVSGRQGAAAIARMFRERGLRFGLVLDEGGFITERVLPTTRRPVALVGIAEKGYLDLELVATAPPGHSATPPPLPAIGKLARAIDQIARSPMPPRLAEQAPFFRAAARAAPLLRRPLLRLVPHLGRLGARLLAAEPNGNALIRTTIAPTVVSGGSRANTLPETATAILNVRILPGDTTSGVLEHLEAAAGDLVRVRPVDGFEPSPVSPRDGPGFAVVADAIRSLHPDAVVAPWVVIGATDSRYFTRLADEVLRFTPFRVDRSEATGFHGTDERIRLADAAGAVAFYRTIIDRLCG